MIFKLTLLLFFEEIVVAHLDQRPLGDNCIFNHEKSRATCSNFKITQSEDLISIFPVEKLILNNVSGSLNFSEVVVSNLTYLSISKSHIDNVIFDGFPNLLFLVILRNTKFPNLTQDLFGPSNNNLNWLSLISNNHTIESNALHFLQNLTWLHIQNQNFEQLTAEFLQKNTKLHELTIRNCQLKKVDFDAFENNPDIEILSMNFNKIDHFESGTFRNLNKLKILELHHNRFVSFNLDQFLGLVNLEVLGLPSNFLKHVQNPDDFIEAFPKLKKMEVKREDRVKDNIKMLIQELRKRNIQIIGTPHDCHHSPLCHHIQQ